jgi:uncharacterized coiled-coil protein SlyX
MTVSLDFIAAQLQRVLEGQARIEQRLTSLESNVAQHRDEMTVLTGMVMHYAGEHIAWGGMQSELRKLRERVEALEGKT